LSQSISTLHSERNLLQKVKTHNEKSLANVDNFERNEVEVLKTRIRAEIDFLVDLLSLPEFEETALLNGWLSKNKPDNGLLFSIRKNLDPSKKYALKRINRFLRDRHSQGFQTAASLLLNMESLPLEILKVKTREYFKKSRIGEIVKMDENQNGIQLKIIATVLPYHIPVEVKWFVKTHSGGLLRDTRASTTKAVDSVELFTYKILEFSGYGAEVVFFYEDLRNFYIGSKDVATFSENQIVRRYPSFLTENKSDFTEETKLLQNVEGENPIVRGLMTADILTRILRLTDVLTQDGNILFVKVQDCWHLKVIDFRTREALNYPTGKDLFESSLCGTGQFFYLGQSDEVMCYYLGTKDLKQRVDFVCSFDYKHLIAAVIQAENEMIRFLSFPEHPSQLQKMVKNIRHHSIELQKIINSFEACCQVYVP